MQRKYVYFHLMINFKLVHFSISYLPLHKGTESSPKSKIFKKIQLIMFGNNHNTYLFKTILLIAK